MRAKGRRLLIRFETVAFKKVFLYKLGFIFLSSEQISPRPEVAASNSPPSYNQLNYNANLARFFNSQPKTLTLKEVESMRYDAAKRGTNMVYGDSSR